MLNGISWQLMSEVILQAQGSLFPPCFWLPSYTPLATVASSFAINKVQKVTFAYWPRRKSFLSLPVSTKLIQLCSVSEVPFYLSEGHFPVFKWLWTCHFSEQP